MDEQPKTLRELLDSTSHRLRTVEGDAWRKPSKYPTEFKKFLEHSTERERILSDMKEVLERFFLMKLNI